MLLQEIITLTEAKIYGNMHSSNLVRISISDNGSTVVVMPEEIAAKHYGRITYRLNPEGIKFVTNIKENTPKIEEYGRITYDQKTIMDTLEQHIDKFLSYLIPDISESDLKSKELANFYKSELSSLDIEHILNNVKPTLFYGKVEEIKVYVGFTGLQYLLLDNTKKILSIVDNTKRYNTRMRNYKGSREFILIDSDFTIGSERILRKILLSLCSKFSELKDYILIDNRSGKSIEKKIEDIISQKYQNPINTMVNKTVGSIMVYHGTSKAILKQIVTKGFMIPGLGPDYYDKIKGHSDDLIYFSSNIEEVRKFAVRAAGGRDAVILKVELNDMTKLRFDEDSIFEALKIIPEKIKVEYAKRIYNEFAEKFDLSKEYHTLSNLDSFLRGTIFSADFSTFTPKQKQLMAFLNSYALKTHNITSGHSFGYAGRIPLSKIWLVEEFKSMPYKDTEANWNKYDSMYDEVKGTQKLYDDLPLTSFKK